MEATPFSSPSVSISLPGDRRPLDQVQNKQKFSTTEMLISLSLSFFFFFFCFLGPHLLQMEAPRLRVQSELQLPAYTTITATQDPRHTCNPHRSSWQRWILNPLSDAREWTHILMDTIRVCQLLSHDRNCRSLDFNIRNLGSHWNV